MFSDELKLRRTDNIVILVADSVLTLTIPDGEDGDKLFNKIQNLVDKINSGLLKRKKEASMKEELLNLMIPKKPKVDRQPKGPVDESYLLAEEVDEIERKEKMKRIAGIHDEFEYDQEGYTYLKNFSVPIPNDLADALLDAHYNKDSKYTVQSLVNFWQWALLNSNSHARNDLFKWFKTGNFSITESGMVVAYRCVAFKQKGFSDDLTNFLDTSFVKIKKWKKSPKNYGVIFEDNDYKLVNLKKDDSVIDKKRFKGFLSELYADKDTNESGDIYTDNHTRTMTIKIGEEVRIDRNDCDEDREAQCSRGLHFMSKKYSLRLGEEKLIVLINPMDIVAFPSYDQSKGRSCAYFPVAKALLDEDGTLEEFEGGTYDFEYANYGKERLDELFKNHSLEDLKREGVIGEDVSVQDIAFMRESINKLLKDKVIDVN